MCSSGGLGLGLVVAKYVEQCFILLYFVWNHVFICVMLGVRIIWKNVLVILELCYSMTMFYVLVILELCYTIC